MIKQTETVERGMGPPIRTVDVPAVLLKDIAIVPFGGSTAASGPVKEDRIQFQNYRTTVEFFLSVALPQADVDTYVALLRDLSWCQAMRNEPTMAGEDRERIGQEQAQLTLQYERWLRAH